MIVVPSSTATTTAHLFHIDGYEAAKCEVASAWRGSSRLASATCDGPPPTGLICIAVTGTVEVTRNAAAGVRPLAATLWSPGLTPSGPLILISWLCLGATSNCVTTRSVPPGPRRSSIVTMAGPSDMLPTLMP